MIHKNHIIENTKLSYNYVPPNKYTQQLKPWGAAAPIFHLLDSKSDLVGAEIGVFRGESSLAMLTHLDIKKLYLIDAYDRAVADSYNPSDGSNRYVGNVLFEKTQNKLSSFNSKIEWLRMDSKYACEHIEDGELDFVFVDGAHTYDGVMNDLKNYYPKVKSGGFICGDDFSTKYSSFGVVEAVNDFFSELGYKELDVYKHPHKPENYYATFGLTKK